ATLNAKSGLPCDGARWSIEDDNGALWVNTYCALTKIDRAEVTAWVNDSTHRVRVRSFDIGTNAISPCCRNHPRVTKGRDGRICFVDEKGLSEIDPRHVPVNTVQPPAYVTGVTANGTAFAPDGATVLRLPANVRSLQIQYTSPSLVAPEKVRFRFI